MIRFLITLLFSAHATVLALVPYQDIAIPLGAIASVVVGACGAFSLYVIRKLQQIELDILKTKESLKDDQKSCSDRHEERDDELMDRISETFVSKSTSELMLKNLDSKVVVLMDLVREHLAEDKERSARILELLELHRNRIAENEKGIAVLDNKHKR